MPAAKQACLLSILLRLEYGFCPTGLFSERDLPAGKVGDSWRNIGLITKATKNIFAEI